MPRRALPLLTTTGNPDHVALEANVRNALDQTHVQLGALTAADIAYEATTADWVAPAPTTVAEALRRLAAFAHAASGTPVP